MIAKVNMTKDPRKNLDIEYNSLNLLSEVKQGGARKAKYIYAADGTKLGVTDAGGNGYDYRGSLIYKSTSGVKSLESAAFSDGRITKTNSTYDLAYNLTDHLGSVRVVFDGSGNVAETNDYYVFGGRHAVESSTISDNRLKFNGKEEQTTGKIGFLDYGARMYDDVLGRWFVQDPAEQFNSPYNFCGNNPLLFVDPNGMLATIYEDEFGNGLLNTNDGSNAIITVPNDRKTEFLRNILATFGANPGSLDSYGWNHYWKSELTGLKWDNELEDWVNTLHSKKAIKYGIQYLQGIEGAGSKFLLAEAVGQWTDPQILLTAASAFSTLPKVSKGQYSVYQGLDDKSVKYIGITKRSPNIRFGEHGKSMSPKAGLDYRILRSGLRKEQARIMEQTLINKHGLENLHNKINSISPSKWKDFGIKK